ncbi:cell division protein FtsQ/DivIB [Terriglobus sp. RCC_193]|uniref:cell division protein FtsQ/DivIB n=1 Tax=Terriglobus sp. RCC_193 TaxID=3239218 RepID=UPI00352571F5
MRKLQKNGGAVAAVLDDEDAVALRPEPVPFRRPAVESVRPRREMVDDFAEDADTEAFLRASGRNRRIRRGLIPRTRNGWIIAGVSVGLSLGVLAAGCYAVLHYMTTSDTFRITSSQQMELDGNSHLSRAQMLSVFGEDVDRNIFHVPLEERRTQLEQMPWVEHATVMRLLPNRLRVHVTERVPVAYLRQGGDIGLIDASGVVLDIPPDAPGNARYTFPVITGIKTADAAASRQQKMQLYAAFLKDLDSDGKDTSAQLSEVDLSDPEDVKALIPYSNQDVMVHFGTQDFLKRFHKFQEHIAEWHTTYPRLNGVDMRYERQVVLQMPTKDSTVVNGPAAPNVASAQDAAPAQKSVPVQVAKANVPVKASAPAAKAPAVNMPAKSVEPKPHAPAAHKTSAKAQEKEAATRKRVEAIKAWMAKREKARSATKTTAKTE